MGKSITAHTALAAIDESQPGLPTVKKYLLLFFMQGHHLGNFDEPLFDEPIYATDHGVDLGDLTPEPAQIGTSRPLNTIDLALARYGNLTAADLRTLVQASQPWQLAMKSTVSQRIEWAWLRNWFTRPEEVDDPTGERFTRADAEQAAAFLRSRRAS